MCHHPLKSRFRIFFLSAVFFLIACSHTSPFISDKLPTPTVPSPDLAGIEFSFFFIGDAGEPDLSSTEPTLLSLTRQLSLAPEKSTAIFLGDNIYPAGLPDSASPDRREKEEFLRQQLLTIKNSGARGIFTHGNHDWDRYGRRGWDAVRRQEAFATNMLGAQIDYLPGGGCPGPAIVDFEDSARLIVLDTQWWLHPGDKPRHPHSTCAQDSEEEVLADLQKAVADAGSRAVLIAAHHPLDTHGVHGGFFGWRDHLFPLLNLSKYLWIPLPGIGSLYPLVRSLGVSDQDMAGGDNRKMREAFESALESRPPLIYASGHEHALQILTYKGVADYLIVSGHGSRAHTTAVTDADNTLFAHQHPGFVKVDFLKDGRVRLGVIEPQGRGETDVEVFSMWLRDRAAVHGGHSAPTGAAAVAGEQAAVVPVDIGEPVEEDPVLPSSYFTAHGGPLARARMDPPLINVAEDSIAVDTTRMATVIPGARYKAGGLHKFFFGAHHREEWTTPIKAPILDLGAFRGGLTPIKRGGGFQTKSLRFRDGRGMQWQFRSIDKDPTKVLPPELQETIAKSIIQDQISISHPYSALVVKCLAEAVGVLHANPILVVLPDDPRLGEFRADFGGLFGLIEERPTDGPDGEPGFAGSTKIVDSQELFDELDKDNDERVNPRAFLTARLLDIFVGDWDRHVDQWRWARFKEGDKDIWYPIPRDRDQAFAFYDGVFPSLADKRWMVRQMEGYNKEKPDVVSLTHSGRHLDRRILPYLSRDEWCNVTQEVAGKLTDAVLEEAVRNLPPEVYSFSGPKLLQRLKTRRDVLTETSDEFYKYLARYVDVRLSDKAEFVEINRLDNGDVMVTAFKRDKTTGEKRTDAVVFQRAFKHGETGEVRVYLMGGDDKVEASGSASHSITVRAIGGADADQFVDQSKVSGYFLGLVPFIPDAETKTLFYDHKDSSSFVSGPSTQVVTRPIAEAKPSMTPPPPKLTANKPIELRDYGHDVRPMPFFGYTADEGIFLGGGPVVTRYQFGKFPYAYKLSILGNYSFTSGAFRLAAAADIVDVFPGVRLNLDGRIDVPRAVKNFYGFGNNTTRDETLDADDFYKVKSDEYALRQAFNFRLSDRSEWFVGSSYSFTNIRKRDSPFVRQAADSLYGAGKFRQLAFSTGLKVDTRDRPVASRRGFLGNVEVTHYPDILDLDDRYTRLKGEARVYLSDTLLTDFTVAFRVGGQKLWGRFPFFEAAFLGGKSDLRGFRRERFAGEAAAWGSAELRFYLTRIWLIFPADFGLFTFADAGRVWVDDTSPGDWHSDTGVGIWFAPVRRDFTISVGAGFSNEGSQITAGLGFAY